MSEKVELLHEQLELSAMTEPGRDAVVCPVHGRITYRMLRTRTHRLAEALQRLGVVRGDRVAICLERSSRWVWSIYGVLRAGAAYVPIHDRQPQERCRQILRDAVPKVVICERSTSATVERSIPSGGEQGPELLVLDDPSGHFERDEQETWAKGDRLSSVRGDPTDLAYIMYTSGSSGRPKGVMISHENVLSYAAWGMERFSVRPDDRVLSTAPFHFDMSTFDVHVTVRAAASLVIASERDTMFPSKLVEWIAEQRVTLWKGIPSLLMLMSRMGALKPTRLESLRAVLFGGEALDPKYLDAWMQCLPGTSFFNVYGPTEATGVSTCHSVGRDAPHGRYGIPIGRPCDGKELFVLREDGAVAECDEIGEICISGAGVSPGYWKDAKRTSEVFVTWLHQGKARRIYRTGDLGMQDEAGDLHFVGRRDDQVKFRGHRIELGEIAACLMKIHGVSDAAVQLLGDSAQGEPEIVAFVECSSVDVGHLRGELAKRVPDYMVPRRILPIERIPRTDRGKVDRAGLRALWMQAR